MPTLLQNLCIGQYQACLLVFTRLASDCSPLTGPNDQVRTSCFASVDAQPQYDDGAEYGRRSTNGLRCFYVRDCNHFKQIDLTFQIITWDMELIELATGADVLTGKTGTPFVGRSMGFGLPGADAACPSGVSVEVYTKAAYGTGGFCVSTSSGAPTFVRHLFPFARLSMGQVTLDDSSDGILLNMTGFGMANPNWGNGPGNDWPGAVDVAASSPYAAVFTNTKPLPTCGYINPGEPIVPPPAVMSEAVFWIDAASDSTASLTSPNLGTGGVAMNAQYGSLSGTDANDPKWLPSAATVGGAYAYFPGLAGNYLTTPHAAPLSITGDITFVADLTMPDWTPASAMRFGGKENLYDFHLAGSMLGFVYFDGATVRSASASVAVPFADGTRGQVAMTKKTGTGTNDVKFFTRLLATDPWVQLGTTQSSAGTVIGTNALAFYMGGDGAGTQPMNGIMHQFVLYNTAGAAGEPATTGAVLDVNLAVNVVSGDNVTFTATTGQTITVIHAASGRKTVIVGPSGRARWLFGTDDYLKVPHNALIDFTLTDSFSVVVVRRIWDASAVQVLYKRDGVGNIFYSLAVDGTGPMARLYDAAGNDLVLHTTIIPPNGQLFAHTFVRDVGTDTLRTYVGGTAAGTMPDTTTATLANGQPLYIGSSGTATPAFLDAEVLTAAIWRRVLTPAEVATIAAYYGV